MLGLVILVALGLYQGLWHWLGDPQLPSVWSGVFSLNGGCATALCLLSYGLRGQRWRLWVAASGYPTSRGQGLRVYLAGYSLTPTPGNLGEAARGLLMRPQAMPVSSSVAVFAAERLQDLLVLVLLAVPALLWSPVNLPAALVVFVGGLVLLALWLSGHGPAWAWGLGRVPARIRQVLALDQAEQCLRHRPYWTQGLTLLAWSAQGLAVWLLCQQADLPLDALQASAAYAMAMVAGALSTLPAGLGGMEATLLGLLTQQGVSTAQAVLLTLQVRLLTLWLAVAIGLLALVYGWWVDRNPNP